MKTLYAAALILMSFHVSAAPNTHLTEFVKIFNDFCFNYKHNPRGAVNALESRGLKRNPQFQDAYEILIDGIDYAVTPQQLDCTADVLVGNRTNVLFSRNEINKRLKTAFNLTERRTRYFDDVALNNKNTRIRQTDYIGKDGFKYRLLYPETNQNSYYMTFTIDW
ncbi:MAG: hypothetical protein CSB47_02330 [Proteobacteria bacterium]|nr:MAG: hypothetical protein CSB47_02330 [Pseudomonadota bacterium]